MDNLVTPDGVQRMREGKPGPIVFRIAFSEALHKQNQVLRNKNFRRMFLQLRDSEAKATAYLCDEAFDKLHEKLLDGDLIEIFRYEVQEAKPGQKIVKVTMAEVIGGAPEDEIDHASNSFDNLNPFDRPLVPTREDRPPQKTSANKAKLSISKDAPLGKSFQNYLESLGKPKVNEYKQDQSGQNINKPSPFNKEPSTTKRNVDNVTRTLFSGEKNSEEKGKNGFQNPYIESRQQKRKDDDDVYTPISNLALWDKDWMLKVRVYFKGNKVKFSRKDYSESSLFTINMIDKDGSEISATFFDNACVEKYYDMIEVGKTYALSGGVIKSNPKKFGKSTNDLQINFDSRSPVSLIEIENDKRIGHNLYNFLKIQNIYSRPVDSLVDVVGIVVRVGEVETVDLGDRKAIPIKKIEIMDDALKPIEVALWDYKAALQVKLYDLIMISPAKIKEFARVRTLSVPARSETILNNLPDVPVVRQLCEWFNNADKKTINSSASVALLEENLRMISELEEEKTEVGLISWIRASVTYIYDDKIAFAACPQCQKQIEFGKEQYIHEIQMTQQVQNTHNFSDSMIPRAGNITCPKCDHSFPTPVKKSMIKVKLADSTGSLNATAFGSCAEIMTKMDTEALFEAQIMHNNKEVEKQLYQEYKIKVKYIGMYQDQKNYVIQKVLPLDYPGECQEILSRLETFHKVAPKEINSLYDLF